MVNQTKIVLPPVSELLIATEDLSKDNGPIVWDFVMVITGDNNPAKVTECNTEKPPKDH